MAKINLLTIHWGGSYGALMQTYATVKILEGFGHNVKVINLINQRYKHPYHTFDDFLRNFIRNIQYTYYKHKLLSLTNRGYNICDIKIPDADYTIVGSDQVWNPDVTNFHSLHYFLDFVPDEVRRMSLSSSFGRDKWDGDNEFTDKVSVELKKFIAVSVRETIGKNILKDVFKIDADLLIDPTLAYCNFEHLLRNKKKSNALFPFIFAQKEEDKKIVDFVVKSLNLKEYKITVWDTIFGKSPISWLEKIHNAPFVVTNSFHCIAFCLMFHTPFIVLNCGAISRMPRIFNILEMFRMSDRYVPSIEYLHEHTDILFSKPDFAYSDIIIKKESNKYKNFVKKYII